MREELGLAEKPIIFISHSLEGIIVKKVITLPL
jgi:predicted alpha/beta hydrolase family esterase